MKSSAPKVLHPIMGKPMLLYCLDAVSRLRPRKTVVVVGSCRDEIKAAVGGAFDVTYAVQKEQKGTAHALIAATPFLKGAGGTVLVTNGDTPLVTHATLRRFLALHERHRDSVSILSFLAIDPSCYGRIIRDPGGNPLAVVEEKDASAEQRSVNEVNSGVYAIEHSALSILKSIGLNRKKGEYYLTDILCAALDKGMKAGVYRLGDEDEFLGVNTREDLLMAQDALRLKTVAGHAKKGVIFLDPPTAYIGPDVKIGAETLLYPNVCLEGNTRVGRGCVIYPGVRVSDSRIHDRATIKDSSVIAGSSVGAGAQIGPFAHIRPGSLVGDDAGIGNFVEVKKTSVGKGSKAMHLSYLGDSALGKNVNVGAGTITCNYDGKKKHRTVIGDNVFIGSDTQLIAPVKVGKGAFVGAGSTITSDVPPGSLALSRCPQKNIKGWKRDK